MDIEELFDRLWADYAQITPQAEKVHRLLEGRGETVVNDHIALRTFGVPEVEIERLDRAFVEAGYEPAQSYEFEAKKLFAYHYEHPSRRLPKVFISSLEVEELSEEAQQIIAGLVAEVPADLPTRAGFCVSGRPWEIDYATYARLLEESEYAAWVAAFGFRANHFTISVNDLKSFSSLEELNAFLEEEGFRLSDKGGAIKGGPEVYLEQSATVADEVDLAFSDRTEKIPSCYYEFALRHPLPSGELFQGFVAPSADKLFESTDTR